jgi:LuxR family transcriptional regulator, maltose regulon positive regulatory protein
MYVQRMQQNRDAGMSNSSAPTVPLILTTKLYIPPPRRDVVLRPRLIERLTEGLHRKLTLISAPAGFGKTTLVSAWVAECEQRDPKAHVAWLSLDEHDNDLTRFLTYFIAALQTLAPMIAAELLPLLHAPQKPPTESLLTALLNDLTRIREHIILILDDYHLVDARPIDDALTFLIDHLPPQMHLIITTREDPDLPLARLRARGQLTELRARDLRFTPAEAAEFLNHGMGLNLSAEDIAALEDRTEGWIAGLQLAALSLQGQLDIPEFIRVFAGDHRYIVDYLVEEVLERQPESVRRFLLQTAILDRFTAPLCDAVTQQQDGSVQLEALERGNFFIVPLDDKRQWYRYHHLFADVLSVHLRAEQPDQVPVLHRRASTWYEQNNLPFDAIHHALVAEDYPRAAALIERMVPIMRRSRQESMLLGWLHALPDEIIHTRPVLSVHYAGALLQSGVLDGVEARLSDAERWLDAIARKTPAASLGEMMVVNEEEFRLLPASIGMYRAAIALFRGNTADTMKQARRIPDLVREDDHLPRGAAAGLVALAYWTSGEMESARHWYSECMTRLEKVGYLSDAVGSAIALADILIAQGHLRNAMSIYERGLQLAAQNTPVLRGAADMHIGMSQLHYERADLTAAAQHLLRSQELGEFAGLPQSPYRWRVAMARIRQADGDFDGALALLHEAERLYVSDFSPNVHPISALKARMWITQGRLSEAVDWVHQQGLSAQDNLSYLREFEHMTLARVLLARCKTNRAGSSLLEVTQFLDRLLIAAEAGVRTGSVIEILILQAMAHQMQGDVAAGLVPLQRALTLAEPEGYVRLFVDEGAPMTALLEAAAKQQIAPSYIDCLLRTAGKPGDSAPFQQAVTDPLSERELEVLRLLATDLSGPEIARELVISLNTLRTHTKNIFTKLGANNRRAAVHRADDLNLL